MLVFASMHYISHENSADKKSFQNLTPQMTKGQAWGMGSSVGVQDSFYLDGWVVLCMVWSVSQTWCCG